jgi:hypothetical protein
MSAFEKLCKHHETNCEQGPFTFNELYGMTKGLAGDCGNASLYTVNRIKEPAA